MARWKPLPAELDPRVRQLIEQLRRLKDAHDLSLARLAARTGYSASSWERYLSGRSLPPREAVEAMARACGVAPARLLALHEVAGDVWPGAASAAAGPPGAGPPGAGPPPGPGRRRRRAWTAAAVAVPVLAAGGILLAVHPWQHGQQAAAPHYSCHYTRHDGRWFAGLSRTRSAILQMGMAGGQVAEAQCLLRRADLSPGEIDGIYGELTERAVLRLQSKHRLQTDGVIGPQTWEALRG